MDFKSTVELPMNTTFYIQFFKKQYLIFNCFDKTIYGKTIIKACSKREMSSRPCVGEHKNYEKTIVNTKQSGSHLIFPATKDLLHCRGGISTKTSFLSNFSYHRCETGGIIKLNTGFDRYFVSV